VTARQRCPISLAQNSKRISMRDPQETYMTTLVELFIEQ
jgi:hypothetical protein